MTGPMRTRVLRVVPWLLLMGLAVVIVRCAWESDDAWITFRTVKNAWSGHGLTWNPDQRVQAYTHPLWMFVAMACYRASGELYFSTLFASIALALLAAGLVVWRWHGSPGVAALVVLVLGGSGAYVDYATSGLENALLYALIVAFVGLTERPVALGLVASAVALTRLDALLLVLPVLGGVAWRDRSPRVALVSALPLLAWEAFSLVYYGALVPNTAIAKLNVALPTSALARQGLVYLWDSLAHDPATLLVILFATALTAWRGSTLARLGLVGVLCYLAYVVRIGGDFMTGRFIAVPFIAAIAWLLSSNVPVRPLAAGLGLLACVGFAAPMARWRSGLDYAGSESEVVRETGIADERAYYYPTTGLLRILAYRSEIDQSGLPIPPYSGARAGLRFAASSDTVAVWNEAGYFGYFSGDKTVIDVWALGDPLLARIPFRPSGEWRVGHYEREVPAGYVESRRAGRNLLEDPALARLYDALHVVVSGPLFTTERWREIWRLNTGYYDP